MIPKGVSYDKHSNKYKAYVDMGGYKMWLGSFQTEQEAMRVAEETRLTFRNKNGLYDFSKAFSENQLRYIFGYFLTHNVNDFYGYRRLLFKIYLCKISLPLPEPKENKSSFDNKDLIISLLLNGNAPNQISTQLHLPRRYTEKIYSQLQQDVKNTFSELLPPPPQTD